MTIIRVDAYQTDDGKLFYTREQAEDYDREQQFLFSYASGKLGDIDPFTMMQWLHKNSPAVLAYLGVSQ